MLIYDNLIVLSVPKTATTSIESVVKECSLSITEVEEGRELTHSQVKEKGFYTGQPVLAMMREPTDWLVSWYNYLSLELPFDHHASPALKTFEKFAKGWFVEGPRLDLHYRTQSEYLLDKGKRPEYLFKYENIDSFVGTLNELTDENIVVLPKKNVSLKRQVSLSDEMLDYLDDVLREDYELYHSIG